MLHIDISKQLNTPRSPMHLEVNVDIKPGARVALFGESGAGKTSILRMVSGLMHPNSGEISYENTVWTSVTSNTFLKPQKRSIGYVFQDYALFPNMTVERNLTYAAQKGIDNAVVKRLIQIFELEQLTHQLPLTLSGGQQQRVALARALMQQPSLLLLDEPLSALDFTLRRKIQDHLIEAHKEFGFTMILVTHDHAEIFRLSDQIIWMKNGKVFQQGHPSTVLGSSSISGKFKMTGEVIEVHREEIIDIIDVLVANEIIQVVVDRSHAKSFAIGDRVMVVSKAFNPIIQHLPD